MEIKIYIKKFTVTDVNYNANRIEIRYLLKLTMMNIVIIRRFLGKDMTTRINRKTAGFYNSVIIWQEVGTGSSNYPQRFRLSVIKAKLLFTAGIQGINKLNICYILIFLLSDIEEIVLR